MRQSDHPATWAWFGDRQANGVADHNLSADPVVLHEARIIAASRYDDVGTESAGLEAGPMDTAPAGGQLSMWSAGARGRCRKTSRPASQSRSRCLCAPDQACPANTLPATP